MKAFPLVVSVTLLVLISGCSEEQEEAPPDDEPVVETETEPLAEDLLGDDLFDPESLDPGGFGADGAKEPEQGVVAEPDLPEGAVQIGTMASQQLLEDILDRVLRVAAVSMECGNLENFEPYIAEMPAGNLGSRSWRELWVVQGCGGEHAVEIRFSETQEGIEWSIEGADDVLQQAPPPLPQPDPQRAPDAQQPEAPEPEEVATGLGSMFEMLDVCDMEPTEQMTELRDMQRALFEQSEMDVEAFDAAFEAGRQQVEGEWEMLTDEQKEASCEAVRRDLERAEG